MSKEGAVMHDLRPDRRLSDLVGKGLGEVDESWSAWRLWRYILFMLKGVSISLSSSDSCFAYRVLQNFLTMVAEGGLTLT